jgi:enoyl-CoA hydratase/carnithine racemase
MTEHIQIIRDAGILTLVLDRPAKKNALTDAMYRVLADELERCESDPATHVVVLRAEGETFSSGNDVSEFAAVAMGAPGPESAGRFLRGLARASKPLVAAVQGRAIGVGTTMLLHFDHVILAEDAQLSTPFVNLALVPEAASSLLLPARIGHARAFTMFALGEPVAARDAVAWGLANAMVPAANLAAAAQTFAGRLARQPVGALVAMKKLMRPTDAITRQMELEGREFLERLRSAEAKEAFRAFAERRAPDFTKVS